MVSYAWQVITLTPLFPSERTSCPYPPIMSAPTSNPYKIGLLCVFENTKFKKKGNNYWNNELNDRILRNRKEYVKLHNYDLIITPSTMFDHHRPIAWSKLLAIKYYLNYYDYIFYVDMDVVILNMNINLYDIIHYAKIIKNQDLSSSSNSNSNSVSNSDISNQRKYLSTRVSNKITAYSVGKNNQQVETDDIAHTTMNMNTTNYDTSGGSNSNNNNNKHHKLYYRYADIIISNDHNGLNTG